MAPKKKAKEKEEKEKFITDKELKEKLVLLEVEIRALGKIGHILLQSNLTKRAILLLLRDMTGLGMNQIESVLDALSMIDAKYLKEPRK